MIASLVYDESGTTAILRFSYDRNLVERLKAIPLDFRSYNPETKAWSIKTPYDAMAAKMLREHFPGAEIQDRPQPRANFAGWTYSPPQPTCGCTSDHKLLGICSSASPELVKAALRIAAKKNHPDLGGSTTQMQAINAAADRLLQEAR